MFGQELDEESEDEAESYLQPRISSITELGLDDCDISLTYLSRFLSAPARLLKFSIEPRPRASLASDDLVGYHAHTLVELNAPGIEGKYLKKLKSLTVFDSLCIDTLVVHVGRDGPKSGLKHQSQPRSVQMLDLSVVLSPTVKKLRLQPGHEWKHGPQPLEQLLSMLADLGDNPQFTGLEEVCMWDLMPLLEREEVDMVSLDGTFCQAVARMTARDVALHHDHSEGGEGDFEHRKLHQPLTGQGVIETDPLRD